MAFINHGTLTPHGAPVNLHRTITNDLALTIGDSVQLTSGFVAAGTATNLVFGHVVGVVTNQGMPMNTTGVAGSQIGSYVGTFTAAANNETVDFVKAICDVSKHTLYSASFDSFAPTTGWDLPGYFCDLDSATDLDESDTTTTTSQYALHGVDPNNSVKSIVNIYESQVFGV